MYGTLFNLVLMFLPYQHRYGPFSPLWFIQIEVQYIHLKHLVRISKKLQEYLENSSNATSNYL